MSDIIQRPAHYAEATHGLTGECITWTEHLGFVRGNSFKYVWRAGFKGDATIDLEKAAWYARRDITHGGANNPEDHPGHLTYTLNSGPMTLRRRILTHLWSRHDLRATLALIALAIENPTRLDEPYDGSH